MEIDFNEIEGKQDFYQALRKHLDLPDYFGDNLDALYDVISGDLEMPLSIRFVNMNMRQLEEFDDLIETLEELADEVDGFEFTYFLDTY